MALHRFKVTDAAFGGIALSDVEVAVVYGDSIVGDFGLWTVDGRTGDPEMDLPDEGTFSAVNESGDVVEGQALQQVIGAPSRTPIHLIGRGPLMGEPPRE